VGVGVGAECTHRGAQTATACTLTSPLITNDQLNCWFDFFNSIPLITQWVKLVEPDKVTKLGEPDKVRLDINLGVPDKVMFMQPLLGPGC